MLCELEDLKLDDPNGDLMEFCEKWTEALKKKFDFDREEKDHSDHDSEDKQEEDAPEKDAAPIQTFDEVGLAPWLVKNLKEVGIEKPTQI